MSAEAVTNAELIVATAAEDAVNSIMNTESILATLNTSASGYSNVKKPKNIDWNAQREFHLVTLVLKHLAYKKTDKTMEEKWSNLSRELFLLESFKSLQPLDGYTLQKKFLRLKRKFATKYDLDEDNPQNNVQIVLSLQSEMDNTEKLLSKILAESSGSNYRRDRTSHLSTGLDESEIHGDYEMYVHEGQADEGANGQEAAAVPATTSSSTPGGHGQYLSGTKHKLSSGFEYEFFEFEKEKERKRMAHEQDMEKLRLEAENKQQVLRLELELKRAEIEAKQAEAMKAQSQLTYELLMEMKKLRQQVDGTEGDATSS
jgi:hypothetical protein